MKIQCKECGITFSYSEKEIKWHDKKGYVLSSRCKSCRKNRKQSTHIFIPSIKSYLNL